jgi:hypothetical protein
MQLNMQLDFYVCCDYVLNVPKGTKTGPPLRESARMAMGVKEAVVKNRRATRMFWLAIRAALWGALSRLVGKFIDKFMS